MKAILGQAHRKILPLWQLVRVVERIRRVGQRIVVTNGCFDLLHVGHLQLLRRAQRYGDWLIVAVNSDRSVRALKGSGRPLVPARERTQLLAALEGVDFVTIFDEPTPARVIRHLRPDVLVKGADYRTGEIVGRTWAKRTVRVPLVRGHSTTGLIQGVWRLLDANLNRVREGLRVIEDTARFIQSDLRTSRALRRLRHQLDAVTRTAYPRLLANRNSVQDVGKGSPVPRHKDLAAVVAANFRRSQEALRVLEEYSRVFAPVASYTFQRLRFELYTLEKKWIFAKSSCM
ncbi:MAG: adenylyltransferase/cytidyltransferase family protein [Elusimicrobia bacterium]|nr:adenylyltransferase/cytidyltransferase family protein [Elusimicrobiota bacterium]